MEVVGMRRWQGALRTELAKCMKCDAVKFHYILKVTLTLQCSSDSYCSLLPDTILILRYTARSATIVLAEIVNARI